jgi:nickel/cobalt transporter (NicO) family protein
VSVLLGATHAALPGHGKTVMAAYIAGKRGNVRDAVLVGTTVTVTHTAGVLALGLALSVSSSLAGDRIEGELGVVSGLLVVAVGIGLLKTAWHRHGHDHDHSHQHEHRRRAGLLGMGVAGGLVPSPSALVVLLGAVALGRTAFGVLLVLFYGIGMAATLTAAGLLAVRLTERWSVRLARQRLMPRLAGATPVVTAGLVVAVGLGLAVRSLAIV